MYDLIKSTNKEVAQSVSDAQIVEWFIDTVDVGNGTKATYKRNLQPWLTFLSATNETILGATRETVLAYKNYLEQDGKKPATINTYVVTVRRLYVALESEGVKPNIASNVKSIRRAHNTTKDALTIEQTRALLARKPEEGATLESLRNYAIINLMVRRGLRTCEVSRANIGDIRQINGHAVLYVQGKGYSEKSDFVVLNNECLLPIYRYLNARNCRDLEAPLFASIGNRNKDGRMVTRTLSRIVKNALKSIGVCSPTITAHSLRHTAVTLALIGEAPLQDVQAMARHKSINTTMIYAHNLQRMQATAESAIDRVISA